jgi:hypothetical protein
VKIDEFIHLKSSDASNKGRHIPFIGSLYSDENWKTFSELLEKEKKRLVSQHQDGIADLKWLIPSNAFWGKNDRVRSCLAEISNGIKTTGKKSKTLYDFKVMAPLSSADDHREKKNWFHDLKIVEDHLHGYIDGYLGDAVEVVMLEDRLVAVTYYLNIPESYRVPVPIGFISTDKGVISSIAHSLNGYLSESHGDSRKNLGKLYKS